MDIKLIMTPLLAFRDDDERVAHILSPIIYHMDDLLEDELESLRAKLILLLAEEDTSLEEEKMNNVFLGNVVYAILMELAKSYPINKTDVFTQEPIPINKMVIVSSGYQFNIDDLLAYHAHRKPISTLKETSTHKWLLNPVTHLPLIARDVQHIQNVIQKKGIVIPHLKSGRYISTQNAADLQ